MPLRISPIIQFSNNSFFKRHLAIKSIAQQQKSKYHSYDHPPAPSPFTPTATTILSASIPHLPLHGFTPNTLSLGCTSAGYIPASTNLFPSGAFALVHYHLYTQRIALAKSLEPPPHPSQHADSAEGPGKDTRGVTATVKALTWTRLLGNKDVIHRYQEALALMSLPSNISTSLRELHLLSDEIFFLAGDKSVDTSWYTKRASLSTIYAATEVFMTQDKSPDFRDTKEFMERRFEGVKSLGMKMGSVGQWVGFTARAGVNVLRSKGARI